MHFSDISFSTCSLLLWTKALTAPWTNCDNRSTKLPAVSPLCINERPKLIIMPIKSGCLKIVSFVNNIYINLDL